MTDLRALAGDAYLVRDDGSGDGPEIPGEWGAIYTYSERGDALAVLAQSTAAVRKLAALGLKVLQRGDGEASFRFELRLLPQVAAIIGARRSGAPAPRRAYFRSGIGRLPA
jgi:hypothetical protein